MTLHENITLAYFAFFGRPAVKELSFFSWTRGLGKCYSKDNKKKCPPFYKLLYKKSPQREKNLRFIFKILGETDNLTDLQTVLYSEDAAFCAHIENRYF